MPIVVDCLDMDISGSVLFGRENRPRIEWARPSPDLASIMSEVIVVTEPSVRYLTIEEQNVFDLALRLSGRVKKIIKI